ncbi:MAG: glycosyltransferase family 4 protein [Spongiibacteraceae bacterium]|jgi:UDP-glucose:(heptosyl)LPS alpha-1,3-glucosyltransferase|nr:glycosyltransferase family 4 protein [Spongiibacteraceae bacterium]
MKLAFALFKYFPYGGLQRDMLAIARTAAARGHDVTIYASEWQGEQPIDLPVELLPVRALSNHSHDARFAHQLQERLAGSSAVVFGFNKMPGLDFYYAADSCFAAKAYEQRNWLYRRSRRCRQYLALERAVFGPDSHTEILLISAPEQAVYERYYHTPAVRLHLLPPGIRRDRIMPDNYPARREALRREHGLADSDRLLLFVGSGFRTKGLDRAIAALAALPPALRETTQLWVVGQDKFAPYQKLADKRGVAQRVQFLGGRDDIAELLWSGDLLIHPAYRENTGTVLLEAMIAGLPIVTTSACGYAGYVRDHDMGTVLAEPTTTGLATATAELLEIPREQWVARGRQFAATADIFDMPTRAVELIERLGPAA